MSARNTNTLQRNKEIQIEFKRLITQPIIINKRKQKPNTDQIIIYLADFYHISPRTVRNILTATPPLNL